MINTLKKTTKIKLFLFLVVLCFQTLFSQENNKNIPNDSIKSNVIKAVKSDSLNALILKDFNKKLAKIESLRIADSIKKAALEKQLSSLKTTDNLKKDELLKQLDEISKHESNRLQQKKAEIDALRATAKGYVVKGFFDEDLFILYSKLGSFSAKDRSVVISERIKNLGAIYGYNPEQLQLITNETTIDIQNGEDIVMSICENDAIWNNTSKEELAKIYLQIIQNAIVKYKSETSFTTLAKEIGLALLVIFIIGVLIFYMIKGSKWIATKIEAQENVRIKGIQIKNYTLFDAKRQVTFFLYINNIFKWFAISVVVYIALPIVFAIFPWTKNFAEVLFGYVLNPVKKIAAALWDYLPNLITIIVIVYVFRYVLKGIRFLKTEIENGSLQLNGFYKDWANPTFQIVKVLVYAFMFIVIFPYLPGSDSPIFQGMSVFLGFLFTFGSAGSLSNVMAGLILTYMRLFKIGDRVKIGEVVGDVIEKSMLVTRVRTIKNEIISIPNSTVMNSHTVNYSSDAEDKGLIIHTTMTIGYDVPWKEVHDAFITAALRTDLILKDPKPFVLQTSLDDFYVSYQLNAYTREPNKQAVIYSNLHQNVQDVCNEVGIEILSPHYRAARDGNQCTIPANYLPEDYKSPGFNITINKDDR